MNIFLTFLGLIYRNNIYVADFGAAEMYDGSTNTWKPWLNPLFYMYHATW
jgi:hypothetical protein